jgi:hypothetical protein
MGSVNVERGKSISRSRPWRERKRTVVDSAALASGTETGPLVMAVLSMSEMAGAST